MEKKNDYIQLPPIPGDADPDVVRMIWEYMQITEKIQEQAGKKTDWPDHVFKICIDEEAKIKTSCSDDIEFRESLNEYLAGIILEISQFTCWFYKQAYHHRKRIDRIIKEHPEIKDLFRVINTVFGSMRAL